MKKNSLDIFEVINKITKCDIDYFNKLSESDKKTIAPFVLMKWLTGTKDKKQITNINHIFNPLIFGLSKHQDLLIKLLMVCCTNSNRVKYVKKTAKVEKKPVTLNMIAKYQKCSLMEAKLYLDLYSKEEIIEIIELLGEDVSLLKELEKEFT